MAAIKIFEDNKALIDLIRNHPCLYCNLDKNFKKKDLKELCWTEIATQLECPGINLRSKLFDYIYILNMAFIYIS